MFFFDFMLATTGNAATLLFRNIHAEIIAVLLLNVNIDC